jgi:hypothetical protein
VPTSPIVRFSALVGVLAFQGCAGSTHAPPDAGPEKSDDAGPTPADAGPVDGGCFYPPAFDGGYEVPNVDLGVGFINWTGVPDDFDGGLSPATGLFAFLHCSGFKYLLLDLSTNFCPGSRQFAADGPALVAGFLDGGGVILSVLELGADGPATPTELKSWAAEANLNYTLVIDPNQLLTTYFAVHAWPTFLIIDLASMQVQQSLTADATAELALFSFLVDGGSLDDGGG